MLPTPHQLLLNVLMLVPMILSLTVHEFAHAWSAYQLGDDTASMQGRMTLNPLPHIDPIGTILLPLIGIPFGWAKPVPINPVRFSRRFSMRMGIVITAAAGPFSNVILAVLCTVAFGLLLRWAPSTLFDAPRQLSGVGFLLSKAIQLNVALALFNLLPVPPLDGSRVADGLMPQRLRGAWDEFTRLGPFLLLGVILLSNFILAVPFQLAERALDRLLLAIVS